MPPHLAAVPLVPEPGLQSLGPIDPGILGGLLGLDYLRELGELGLDPDLLDPPDPGLLEFRDLQALRLYELGGSVRHSVSGLLFRHPPWAEIATELLEAVVVLRGSDFVLAVSRLLKSCDDLVLYLQRLQAEQLACKCAAYSIYMDTGHRAWENLKETSLPTLPAKHNINRGSARHGASIAQTKFSAVPRLLKPCDDLVLYLQRLQAERSASKCNLFRRPPT